MAFEVTALVEFAEQAIVEFASEHRDEVFYAFAIDASMLCLNSVDAFEKTLNSYQAKYPEDYSTAEGIDELRFNTGDWEYQGFADFTEGAGFDTALYSEHYNLGMEVEPDSDEIKNSEYALAMKKVIELLNQKGTFKVLNCSKDFVTLSVEHNY